MSETIVRFPPSPTGLLHIGTLRTCLFNYLFAKQNNGKIVMRLEDTDKERSKPEFEENILTGLQKLGLNWDGEIYRQSERTAIYRQYLEELLETGKAYYAFETPEELEEIRAKQRADKLPPRIFGTDRELPLSDAQKRLEAGEKAVIRFKLPQNETDIIFKDLVRGEVKINTRELDDFVIAKNLDTPLYNFTVVVDDHLMKISHVIRGEDHISNTPKQILVYQAFDWQEPQFAHLPLILNQDGSKLSKRKNSVSVDDYLNQGYLPAALINNLALIGWNPGDTREIFSLEELITEFNIKKVQKGGAKFDLKKLEHINAQYIQKLEIAELEEIVKPFIPETWRGEVLTKALVVLQDRFKRLNEAPELLNLFFAEEVNWSPDLELFINPKMKVDKASSKQFLEQFLPFIKTLSSWQETDLQAQVIAEIARLELKNGQVLWPLRVALSNAKFSPSPFAIMSVLGKNRSLARVEKLIELLA